MRRKFIINPVSGGRQNIKNLEEMKKFFMDRTCEFDYAISESSAHIRELTKQALHDGYQQIVPVGGDGTVHQVVNGLFENDELINPEISLGISKSGTGSDFYKSISENNSHRDWRQIILDRNLKKIDLGKFSFHDQDHTEYFINMAGAGISSEIVRLKEDYPKWIPGSLKYFLPTMSALKTFTPTKMAIHHDKGQLNTQAIALFVCLGKYAGGGMKFSPTAELSDGLFDITLIEKMPVHNLALSLPRLYTGTMKNTSHIKMLKTNKVTVYADEAPGLEIDGEYLGKGGFDIEILSQKISVCFPADAT